MLLEASMPCTPKYVIWQTDCKSPLGARCWVDHIKDQWLRFFFILTIPTVTCYTNKIDSSVSFLINSELIYVTIYALLSIRQNPMAMLCYKYLSISFSGHFDKKARLVATMLV